MLLAVGRGGIGTGCRVSSDCREFRGKCANGLNKSGEKCSNGESTVGRGPPCRLGETNDAVV